MRIRTGYRYSGYRSYDPATASAIQSAITPLILRYPGIADALTALHRVGSTAVAFTDWLSDNNIIPNDPSIFLNPVSVVNLATGSLKSLFSQGQAQKKADADAVAASVKAENDAQAQGLVEFQARQAQAAASAAAAAASAAALAKKAKMKTGGNATSMNPGMVQAIKSDLSRQLLMPNGRIMLNRTADVVAGNGATQVTATIPVTPAGPDVTQTDQPAVDTSGWTTGGSPTDEQGVTNIGTGAAAATADTGSIWDTIKEWYWVPIAGATAVAIGAYFYTHRSKSKMAGYRRRRRNRR